MVFNVIFCLLTKNFGNSRIAESIKTMLRYFGDHRKTLNFFNALDVPLKNHSMVLFMAIFLILINF